MILLFLLFASTALIILVYPIGQPFELFRHGFSITAFSENARLHMVTGLAAWFFCLSGLVLMWKAANLSSDSLVFIFTRYLLFAFILFFAIERFAASVFPSVGFHWLSRGQQWTQLVISMLISISAVIVFPHLRNLKEGSVNAKKEHDRFLASVESSLDDFYIFDGIPDASGRIVDFRFSYINPNAERRLNVRRESLIGKVLTEVRPFMISSGLIEHYREVVRTGVPFTCEVFLDDEMIKATWLNVQVVKLGDGIAITSRDVTERKRLTDHVNYLAHYDQLTGLPNRTLLQDRLQQAIFHAQRDNQKVAVFVLDIDYFKRINDSLGHADGDALLAAVGDRLRSIVREMDTVARMGGDEFVIVMPDFKSLEDVKRCGLQIVQNASQPISIGDREINITVSIGVCIYPDSCQEADKLLKIADAAMYKVKEAGRNGLHIFRESVHSDSTGQL